MKAYSVLAAITVGLACSNTATGPLVGPPENLFYRLEASGDPDAPAALILEWSAVNDGALAVYNVYSRAGGSDIFDLRGSTTSLSFHDVGIPDAEYYVVSVNLDGVEGPPSETVIIDERLRLERPDFLASTTLDRAVHLVWGDNPFQTEPDGFLVYRVYSTGYSIDTGECGATWSLEGTTIAPEFIVAELNNGSGFCFGVSAESIEGWESLWSDIVADTPRPDARNVLMYRFGADANASGFRFFLDGNGDGLVGPGELGIVTSGSRNDIDFRLFADGSGNILIEPIRTGVGILQYSSSTVDLTDIDFAPETGYTGNPMQLQPGLGYVFEMPGGDGFLRFGAIRATHVGQDFVLIDWSYQTDPGNPELQRHGGLAVHLGDKLKIKGVN